MQSTISDSFLGNNINFHSFYTMIPNAAINAAISEGVSSRWNGVRPPVMAIPVYDGDGVRPSDGMPFSEECKGHWVFTASSKQAPEIVDLSMQRILSQAEIYSGIYARVLVRFFPYANNDRKGIGCGLGPVQKLEDGEPLGSRVSAEAAFGDNGGGDRATQVQASIYTQQPTIYPQQPVNNSIIPVYNSQMPQQNTEIPQYNPQTPSYLPQQPTYAQPNYATPIQPVYPQQPMQIDPITGAPVNGGVMGL